MATMKPNTPAAPEMGEIAPPDNPYAPFERRSYAAAVSYTSMLVPSDTVLQSHGGIDNLRIYRELLRDDEVAASWLQRRLALTSCETVVEPGADDALSKAAAEALQADLDALNWDNVTDKMLYTVFYGWGVAECIWRPDEGRIAFGRIPVRDRARFRFDHERRLYLLRQGRFELMPDRKFWVMRTGWDHDDEPYGLGLAHSLYWPVFFKRNDIKFWLMFLEKFGMPTAVAKLPPGKISDQKEVEKAKAMLRQIATDAGVVVPENVVVELLEAARSGSADYGAMHEAMNKAIRKIILGQTATVEGTAGRLGSDTTQADVKQSIVEADSDLLCGSFNEGPAKWWAEMNFPGAVPPRVYRRTEPPEDLNQRAERDSKLYAMGFEPSEEYMLETYGEGWDKKPPAPMPAALVPGSRPPGGQSQPDEEGDPADFADPAGLARLRRRNRDVQDVIDEAASQLASRYPDLMGRRVGQLAQAAQDASDYADFGERLAAILAEDPPPELMQTMARAIVIAKMVGNMAAQRPPTSQAEQS